jgi:hypothetical protein
MLWTTFAELFVVYRRVMGTVAVETCADFQKVSKASFL